MARQTTNADAFEAIAAGVAHTLSQQLYRFCRPLLERLDQQIDKRLVRTFFVTLISIVRHRHRQGGLLLSELGAFITSVAHAPAGTKRLSNLLRSRRWDHQLIDAYLLERADERLCELESAHETAVVLWDESVVEKPESIAVEGLCPVRSSKALRLKRIKPGFYNPPGGRPIFVPGLHWISLMLCGSRSAPLLCRMQWWTSRGAYARDGRSEAQRLLSEIVQRWKKRVIHIFDRGYAGQPWLELLLKQQTRFILRWQKHYMLLGPDGQRRKAWQITRGKRSLGSRLLWDAKHQCLRKTGIYYTEVRHEHLSDRLFLVVSRRRAPWYLLTNEPVENEQQAWRIVLLYARRWQVEMGFRYAKSELAMESPRLWFWVNRLKLLSMVALVYAFLLSLLRPELAELQQALLHCGCPRTGKRSREVSAPLYRMRLALSHLWSRYSPNLLLLLQNSG